MRRLLSNIKRMIKAPAQGPVEMLKRAGVLKVGEGTVLGGIEIFVPQMREGTVSIEIGKNCNIQGSMALYRSTSRIRIGDNVYVGPGTLIECAEEIEIGNHVLISSNCNIIDTNSHSLHSAERMEDTKNLNLGMANKNWDIVDSRKIIIADSCWLGLRTVITKGVLLGQGTIVGAGSVVTGSTEAFSVVAGNPARLIKKTD